MKDLYWRLYSAWFQLFEAPSREETLQHERDRAHDMQQQLASRFEAGYMTGYVDAVEQSNAMREMV